jgi:hypothetical protein
MQPAEPPDASGGVGCSWLYLYSRLLNWKEDRMKPHRTRFLTISAVTATAAIDVEEGGAGL